MKFNWIKNFIPQRDPLAVDVHITRTPALSRAHLTLVARNGSIILPTKDVSYSPKSMYHTPPARPSAREGEGETNVTRAKEFPCRYGGSHHMFGCECNPYDI